MDVNEFINETPPKAKRSRLYPFRESILLLKAKGYSNGQIREWLQLNGLEVSQESVRKFINTQKSANDSTRSKNSDPLPAQPPKTPGPNSEHLAREAEAQDDITEYPAHDPRLITQILSRRVDLDELAKYAPKRKKP